MAQFDPSRLDADEMEYYLWIKIEVERNKAKLRAKNNK